jgi:O-antigen ligase
MLGGAARAAGSFIQRIQSAPKESAGAREEFDYAAALMARDHPVFGVGLNNFSYVLTTTPKYNEHIRIMADEKQAGVAHHIYRLVWAETGAAGLLVFVAIILRFWWLAGRAGWHARSLEEILLVGLCLGATTLHLSGFLEWVFRITPVSYMFFVTSAVTVGLAEALRGHPARAAKARPAARLVAAQRGGR